MVPLGTMYVFNCKMKHYKLPKGMERKNDFFRKRFIGKIAIIVLKLIS
ncbi:MAG: hypothetical protein ACI9AT_002197 [Ulvibacter sp.]